MDRRFLRPGWLLGHLAVLLAVLVCLRLGWWQWNRTHDASGTLQNLGYAILWPVFGAAFVFMWLRFLSLEALKDMEGELGDGPDGPPAESITDDDWHVGPATDGAPAVDENPVRRSRTEPPSRAIVLSTATVPDDDDEDPELAAYNRALAALADKDRRAR